MSVLVTIKSVQKLGRMGLIMGGKSRFCSYINLSRCVEGRAGEGEGTGLVNRFSWPTAVDFWKAAGSFAALPSSSSMDLISIRCRAGACCVVDLLSGLNRKPAGGAAKLGAYEGLDG